MPSALRMIDSWLHRPLRFECRSLLRQHVWCQSDGTLQARSSNQYEIAWKGEWVNDRGALSSWAPGWCDYWEYYFAMCFSFFRTMYLLYAGAGALLFSGKVIVRQNGKSSGERFRLRSWNKPRIHMIHSWSQNPRHSQSHFKALCTVDLDRL